MSENNHSVRELRQWLSRFGEENQAHFERQNRPSKVQQRIQKLEAATCSTASVTSIEDSVEMRRRLPRLRSSFQPKGDESDKVCLMEEYRHQFTPTTSCYPSDEVDDSSSEDTNFCIPNMQPTATFSATMEMDDGDNWEDVDWPPSPPKNLRICTTLSPPKWEVADEDPAYITPPQVESLTSNIQDEERSCSPTPLFGCDIEQTGEVEAKCFDPVAVPEDSYTSPKPNATVLLGEVFAREMATEDKKHARPWIGKKGGGVKARWQKLESEVEKKQRMRNPVYETKIQWKTINGRFRKIATTTVVE